MTPQSNLAIVPPETRTSPDTVTIHVGDRDVTFPPNDNALCLRWANGNVKAAEVLRHIGRACQVADDIVDERNAPNQGGRILELIMLLGGALQTNEFYVANRKVLEPIIMTSSLYWDLSNELANGTIEDRKFAYVYREAIEQTVGMVALLTGGLEFARRSLLESYAYHHVLNLNTFEDFNKGLPATNATNDTTLDVDTGMASACVGNRTLTLSTQGPPLRLRWMNGDAAAVRVLDMAERIRQLSWSLTNREMTTSDASGRMLELIVILVGALQNNEFFARNSNMLTPIILSSCLYQDLARTITLGSPTEHDKIYAAAFHDFLEQILGMCALLTSHEGASYARKVMLEHHAHCHVLNMKTLRVLKKEAGV